MWKEYGYELVRNMQVLQVCAHLEALARVAEPETAGARARFTRTLQNQMWSGMSEWSLVSLPRLYRAVRQPSSVYPKPLRRRLEQLHRTCPDPVPAPLSQLVSPPLVVANHQLVDARKLDGDIHHTKKALRATSVPAVQKWCEVAPEFTLAAILWRDWRCPLAHEARPGEAGHGFSDSEEPYYYPVEGRDAHLAIPPAFVLRALGNCIGGVRKYCETQGVDPYERGRFA